MKILTCRGKEIFTASALIYAYVKWNRTAAAFDCLPLLDFGWSEQLPTFFFFLGTDALFRSNVTGLYWGRLLNFFSNSSSSFAKLKNKRWKNQRRNQLWIYNIAGFTNPNATQILSPDMIRPVSCTEVAGYNSPACWVVHMEKDPLRAQTEPVSCPHTDHTWCWCTAK